MSRYLGPRVRVMRSLGIDLPGLSRKSIERRPYPPGQHGPSPKRRKQSDYKLRLVEKQKVRMYYGLSERQMGNLVRFAGTRTGNTGEQLLALLESRLDNVVFRAGFARTIPAARQLVLHGHLLVNGSCVDRAGYRVRPGETITLRERSRELDIVATSLVEPVAAPPSWLAVDATARTIAVKAAPDASSMLFGVDLRLIVEYYAQRA
jgi:small subunit ribosomal protein S4